MKLGLIVGELAVIVVTIVGLWLLAFAYSVR